MELRLDELGDEHEQEESANEGGDEGDLEAVGHVARPVCGRRLYVSDHFEFSRLTIGKRTRVRYAPARAARGGAPLHETCRDQPQALALTPDNAMCGNLFMHLTLQ